MRQQVAEIYKHLEEEILTPYHFLGYVLNPRKLAEFSALQEFGASLGESAHLVDHVEGALRLLTSSSDQAAVLQAQINVILAKGTPRLKQGSPAWTETALKMTPSLWWSTYCTDVPDLMAVATEWICPLSASSGSAERPWREMHQISERRVRLKPSTLMMLAKTSFNMRALKSLAAKVFGEITDVPTFDTALQRLLSLEQSDDEGDEAEEGVLDGGVSVD